MPKVSLEKNLEVIILGFINHEPSSGYTIKKRIEQEVGFFWKKVTYGQIYPTINTLLEEGSITLLEEAREGNRPAKKIYSITKKGFEKLYSWVSIPLNPSNYSFELFQEFLIKLYFSSIVPKEITLQNIQIFDKWLYQTNDLYAKFEQNLLQHLAENKDHKYFLTVLRFGFTVNESLKAWTKNSIDFLEKE